jgi:hypothetical protein
MVAPTKPQILSYGGGVQSVAMAILVATGELPRPDLIVMADTGREATPTWRYLSTVVGPLLAEHDLRVEIAGRELAKVDLYSHEGKVLMPMFQKRKDGTMGKLKTFCSTEWKRYVVMRYVSAWLKDRGLQKRGRGVDVWMGFTIDEIDRVKRSPKAWFWRVYPLIGFLESSAFGESSYPVLSRSNCKDIIRAHGLPIPQKSACWMCPYRSNAEWRELRESDPGDFARAEQLEEDLRRDDPHIYLHSQGVRLGLVDFGSPEEAEAEQCNLGFCMT